MESMLGITLQCDEFLIEVEILKTYGASSISLLNNLGTCSRGLGDAETVPINKCTASRAYKVDTADTAKNGREDDENNNQNDHPDIDGLQCEVQYKHSQLWQRRVTGDEGDNPVYHCGQTEQPAQEVQAGCAFMALHHLPLHQVFVNVLVLLADLLCQRCIRVYGSRP